MRSLIESIALENFKSSGFISRPASERRTNWEYLTPPRAPYASKDALHNMIERRENARYRKQHRTSLLRHCFNAFLHR